MTSTDFVSIHPAGYEDDCDLDDFSFAASEPKTSKSRAEPSATGVGCKIDKQRVKFGKKLSKLRTECNNLKEASTNDAPRVIMSKKNPACIKSADDFKRAIMRNDLHVVKQCLEEGVPADTVFSTSWTALMYAVNFGKPDMVKLLLENGANPNYNKDLLTVLMVACSSSCRNEAEILQSVTLLFEYKADVNAFDRTRLTPLHKAVTKGRTTVVKKLLEAGADIDKQDSNGYTALIMAVKQNNSKMVKILLDAGADYNKQTVAGENAFDLASLSGYTEVDTLLKAKTHPGTTNSTNMTSNVSSTAEPTLSSQLHSSVESTNLLQIHGSVEPTVSTVHNIVEQTTSTFPNAVEKPTSTVQNTVKPNLLTAHSTVEPVFTPTQKFSFEDKVSNKQSLQNSIQEPKTVEVYNYGELEVFLLGLNLGDLIQKFNYHNIQFDDFLKLSDKDLQKLGITQLGVRKKLLDAVQDTHKMNWQTSSVNIVQYNKPITCADAVAMVTNIKKHVSFISSTIGYVTDQIKAKPDILAQAEDHCTSEELSIQSEEAITNVKYLYEELVVLRNFLTEAADRPHYHPASLYYPSHYYDRRRYSLFSVKTILIGVALFGIYCYKRESVYGHLYLLYDKFTTMIS